MRYLSCSSSARRDADLYLGVVADIFWFLLALILACAAGYSWFGEGRDYQNYLNFYQGLEYHLSLRDQRYEPGFVLLAYFFKYAVKVDLSAFIAWVTMASLMIKVHLVRRHTRNPFFAFLVYFCLFYPVQEYAQIRAALALSFAYWAIFLGVNGRWGYGIVLICVALSFHYTSALIGCVFLLIYITSRGGRLVSAALLIGAVVAGAVVVVWNFDALVLINPLLNLYIESAEDMTPPTIFSVLHVSLLFAIFARLMASSEVRREGENVFIWLTIAGLVSFLLLYSVPVLAQRVKDLFVISVVFWALNCRIRVKEILPMIFVLLGGAGVLASFVVQGVIFSSGK